MLRGFVCVIVNRWGALRIEGGGVGTFVFSKSFSGASPMKSGSLPVAISYCWRRCVRATGEGDAEKGYAYQHAGSGKFFITLRQVIEPTVWCCGIGLFARVNIRCNVLSVGNFIPSVRLLRQLVSYSSDV